MSIHKSPSNPKNYWDSLIAEVISRRRKNKRARDKKPVIYKKRSMRRYAKYQLGEPLPGIYLTQREADCIMQMLDGKTMIESGRCLKLSPRTVEFYLSNIKTKLKCRKKREMINLISKTEFAKNFKEKFPNHFGSDQSPVVDDTD